MKEIIRDFILHNGDFNDIALKLFAHQIQQNRAYGLMAQDIRPKTWKEIPAVPVDLFRSIALCCFPPFFARHVFFTSGTTGQKGVHRLMDTELYDLGAIQHMIKVIGGVPKRGISLVSTASTSSLGHMCRLFAPHTEHFFVPEHGLFKEKAWEALRECSESVFFPGTSFAFAELIEGEHTPCQLPLGSVIMITGGFKGYEQKIEAEELHSKLKYLFPNTPIVAEYGMTELSSQLWSPHNDNRYIPPHWMRVLAVDPCTGKETSGIGQLRFYDLANHQSVMAIETQDQGHVLEDGSVILYGRVPKAPPRGCSLDLETVRKQIPPQAHTPILRNNFSQTHPLEKERTDKLHEAFQSILHIPNTDEWGQGLHPKQFRWGLEQSISALSPEGLSKAVSAYHHFPQKIAIVASYGISTSILEWVYLALGMGAEVLLKASKRDPRFCTWLCTHLQKKGFAISCTINQDLGNPELIYAFGSDRTIHKIEKAYPQSSLFCYGHRFSLVYCSGNPATTPQIARDVCAYNGRGCMAPVAVCTPTLTTEFVRALEIAIAEERQTYPTPSISPEMQPFVRTHLFKTKAVGTLHTRNDDHLCITPFSYFTQNTLPNIVDVHEVSVETLIQQLQPWNNNLSSLSTDMDTPLSALFPRVVALGCIQTPLFPRHHDGYPMFMDVE